ncbi:hypothetical protein JTB14_005048 [Gonioctena quinquepunctata]|nr:hypothetical protein JTB14_005048 [Gonioctena quinquepunctata]
MSKVDTEEKSPLLYVLEENDDNSKARKMNFEKSRFNGISSGATAVFTHFPNYIGTCWVTTALCGLVFFMMILLLMSAITTASIRVPRCAAATEMGNNTVHLVHVQDKSHWKSSEVELVQQIIKTYPSYKVRLILIEEQKRKPKYDRDIFLEVKPIPVSTNVSTKATTTSKKLKNSKSTTTSQRRKRRVDDVRFNINMEAKRLIDMLLHGKIDGKTDSDQVHPEPTQQSTTHTKKTFTTTVKSVKTSEDLLQMFPSLAVEHLTFNQVFYSSPLYNYWIKFSDGMKIFAVRVLQLWQFGGISFDLQAAVKDFEELRGNDTEDNSGKKVKQFVISEKNNYEDLPVGVVNVDDRALHMESKVPCHAFFGEILMDLRKAEKGDTVKKIMQKSIKIFCTHFSASKNYCNIFS